MLSPSGLMRLLRGRPTPDEVRALRRDKGERILGWASASGDHRGYLACTNHALLFAGPAQHERIAYDRVIRAAWEEPGLELVIQMESGTPTQTMRLILAEPGRVPAVVRDRVTASVMAQRHVPLRPDGTGARLVARKDPRTEQVRWAVIFDAGLDPADLENRAAADEALREVRSSLGL
jgi:hypothetical protein